MKIGVLSDTHLSSSAEGFYFLEYLRSTWFAEVDVILHAGDMIDPELEAAFQGCTFYGVRGNCDTASPHLPVHRVIELEGKRIGLMHGWGGLDGLEDRILGQFTHDRLDCLVYGHSHYPANYRRGKMLIFNPGSPTDRRRAPWHSVGVLTIEDGGISGEIIRIDEGV